MKILGVSEKKHAHYDDDRDELQPNTPSHEPLRQIRIATAPQITQAEKQHDRDAAAGNGDDQVGEKVHGSLAERRRGPGVTRAIDLDGGQ